MNGIKLSRDRRVEWSRSVINMLLLHHVTDNSYYHQRQMLCNEKRDLVKFVKAVVVCVLVAEMYRCMSILARGGSMHPMLHGGRLGGGKFPSKSSNV